MTLGLQKNIETAAEILQFRPKGETREPMFSVTFASWGPGVVQGGSRLVPRGHFGGILGPMGRSLVLKWKPMGCQSGVKSRFGRHLGSPWEAFWARWREGRRQLDIYRYIYIHTDLSLSLSIYTYIYIYMFLYIYIYIHVCICIYIYIYLFIFLYMLSV